MMRQEFALAVFLLCTLPMVSGGKGRHLSNNLDDILNESTIEDKASRRVDPQGSWLSFVRHSDRINNDRKRRKKSHALLSGPNGPRGLTGRPGARITLDVIMAEFKQLVEAEAEKRAEFIVNAKCPNCKSGGFVNLKNETLRLLELGVLEVTPRVSVGFHNSLKEPLPVQGRTFLELKKYHTPFGGGAFQRGDSFSPNDGRFRCPKQGIYQFTANLHVTSQGRRKGRQRRSKRQDHVRVLICIQSLCQKHTSLEFVSPMHQDTKVFSINLTGVLKLEVGQYASIYVDNSSSRSISILHGSTFTGFLIGV